MIAVIKTHVKHMSAYGKLHVKMNSLRISWNFAQMLGTVSTSQVWNIRSIWELLGIAPTWPMHKPYGKMHVKMKSLRISWNFVQMLGTVSTLLVWNIRSIWELFCIALTWPMHKPYGKMHVKMKSLRISWNFVQMLLRCRSQVTDISCNPLWQRKLP